MENDKFIAKEFKKCINNASKNSIFEFAIKLVGKGQQTVFMDISDNTLNKIINLLEGLK
jgi:hypothetical protein